MSLRLQLPMNQYKIFYIKNKNKYIALEINQMFVSMLVLIIQLTQTKKYGV